MHSNRSTSEIKDLARQSLIKKYASSVGICTIFMMISIIFYILSNSFNIGNTDLWGLSYVFSYVMSFAVSLILNVVQCGLIYFFLTIARGKQQSISDIFWSFSHHPDKIIVISFYITLLNELFLLPVNVLSRLQESFSDSLQYFILFWISLLIGLILVVWVSILYSMVFFVYIDHYNDLSAIEIIRTSRQLIKGHKARYFYLSASFLGWIFMAIFITCGIGMLWLIPYVRTSSAFFYLDITGELDKPEETTPVDDYYNQWYTQQ